MKLSLKTKYYLAYGLSPFFTGIVFYAAIDGDSIPSSLENFNITLISKVIWDLSAFGLFALVLFCIPALITGKCMFEFRSVRTIYLLFFALFIGFICSFINGAVICIFLFGPMSLELFSFYLLLGALGAITSFLITLKLIYYPFKDSNGYRAIRN